MRGYPFAAASNFATSIFFICSVASMARRMAMGSLRRKRG